MKKPVKPKRPNKRPDWEIYFLHLLPLIAQRSPCLSRQVGAILVRDNRIISTGYNGPPPGVEHCTVCARRQAGHRSGERLDLCRAIHAEANAILFARQDLSGTDLYLSIPPCYECAKLILGAGIDQVLIRDDEYSAQSGVDLLAEYGVVIHTWEDLD